MKKNWREIKLFTAVANFYFTTIEGKTKFTYAIEKVSKKLAHILDEYNEEVDDVKIDHANEDPNTKSILYNDKGGYQYTKQQLKDLKKALKKVEDKWNSKEFDIEGYYVTEDSLPEDLDDTTKQALVGFVIEQTQEIVEAEAN